MEKSYKDMKNKSKEYKIKITNYEEIIKDKAL